MANIPVFGDCNHNIVKDNGSSVKVQLVKFENIGIRKASLKRTFYTSVRRKSYIFSLLAALSVLFLCFVPYIVSVSLGHMNPIFPLVSDLGVLPPEASIFTTLFHLTAYLTLISAHFRYNMLKYEIRHQVLTSSHSTWKSPETIRFHKRINFFSPLFAWIAAIGMIIIANFRASEHLPAHLVGSALVMFGMSWCFLIQIYLSFWLSKHHIESRPISMAFWYLIMIISGLSFYLFSYLAIAEVGLINTQNIQFRLQWNSSNPGYVYHCFSTFSEWIAVQSLVPLTLCVFNRMRKFEHFDKI